MTDRPAVRCSAGGADSGLRPGETPDLPAALASVLQPWLEMVATATLGMGERVKLEATNASHSLSRRIVSDAGIERALSRARAKSDALAEALDNRRINPGSRRVEAVRAQMRLVKVLRRARPSADMTAMGLHWAPAPRRPRT